MFRLIGAKLRSVMGGLRSKREGRYRAPLFVGLSVVFWALLFRGSLWTIRRALEIEPVGTLLVQRLLAIVFVVFLALLLFSNLVTVFTTFYLADDLRFLMSKPISTDDLFGARFLEALSQSSWVVIIFGLPIFVAVGVGVGAGPLYYLLLAAVLVPYVALPTAAASLVALVVTNLLAAKRTRDVFLFLGAVAFGLLFVGVRALRPEQLLNPESFDSIGEMLSLLSAPASPYLPSSWCMQVLTPTLFGGSIDLSALSMLYTTPAALYVVAVWCHRPYYARGYSRVQEGRHGSGILTQLRDWLFDRTRRLQGGLEAALDRLRARGERPVGALRQLVRKDQLVFLRDASQWTQLLVVAAITVVYLVNYEYFEGAAGTRLFGDIGLYYFNLAACGFVVVALAGRFLFPAVSLEGRNFWLILQAPISLEAYLCGKWLGAMAPVVVAGQALIWAANLLVAQNWFFCVAASVIVLELSAAVSAMAVGLGAIYPQFHDPNAAKIASSFGAVIYMILGVFLVLGVLAATFHVTMHYGSMLEGRALYAPGPWTYTATVGGILAPLAAAALSIRAGASSLRRRL